MRVEENFANMFDQNQGHITSKNHFSVINESKGKKKEICFHNNK